MKYAVLGMLVVVGLFSMACASDPDADFMAGALNEDYKQKLADTRAYFNRMNCGTEASFLMWAPEKSNWGYTLMDNQRAEGFRCGYNLGALTVMMAIRECRSEGRDNVYCDYLSCIQRGYPYSHTSQMWPQDCAKKYLN